MTKPLTQPLNKRQRREKIFLKYSYGRLSYSEMVVALKELEGRK
jgi:hypothetical protein